MFNDMKQHTKIGLGVTAAWGFICAGLLIWRLEDVRVMTLNEWGDFLAGLAAPIALLWVVIGYFQHGEEIRLNTKVLKLQQEELRRQVEETATLRGTRRGKRRQLRIVRFTKLWQPNRTLPRREASSGGSSPYDCVLNLVNRGATATEIKLHSEGPHELAFSPLARWETDHRSELPLRLAQGEELEYLIRFRLEYTDRLHEKRTIECELWENYRLAVKRPNLNRTAS